MFAVFINELCQSITCKYIVADDSPGIISALINTSCSKPFTLNHCTLGLGNPVPMQENITSRPIPDTLLLGFVFHFGDTEKYI